MSTKPDLATLQAMLANKAAGNRSFVASGDDAPPDTDDCPADDLHPGIKPAALRAKALQYLARRDHSHAELRQKLLPLAGNAQVVDELLEDFAARGWLSDSRFAEQWAHQRSQRYGMQRLRQELRQKGVDNEIIANTLEEMADSEEARARAVWQKRFGTPPADLKEKARQMRFLAARGFSLDVIYKIMDSTWDDEI